MLDKPYLNNLCISQGWLSIPIMVTLKCRARSSLVWLGQVKPARVESELGKLDKTARGAASSKVGLGMTRSGKTRKGETQRRKTRQDSARHGAEQGRAWYD